MRATAATIIGILLLDIGATLSFAQEKPGVKLPPAPSTIPSDVMFALGQQSGQLSGISGRLEKIEGKIEDVQRDVTRINTVGALAVLLLTVLVGPLVVKNWRGKNPNPPAAIEGTP